VEDTPSAETMKNTQQSHGNNAEKSPNRDENEASDVSKKPTDQQNVTAEKSAGNDITAKTKVRWSDVIIATPKLRSTVHGLWPICHNIGIGDKQKSLCDVCKIQ